MKKRIFIVFLTFLSLCFILTSCNNNNNSFSVEFRNYNGDLLYSTTVKNGDTVPSNDISRIKPTKPNDDNYSYTFSYWVPSVKNKVTADTLYVAQYKKTVLPYTFKFNLNGGICDSEIKDKKTNRLDKEDFKFDLHKDNKAFRGWQYNGTLIFDKNGDLKVNAKRFKYSSEMTFDALYEDEYRVTVNGKSNGETYYELPTEIGTISPSMSYPSHGDVSVYATANQGYKFDGWYKGSTKVSKNPDYSFTLWEEDITLTARFVYNSYSLTVMTEDSNLGDIQIKGGNAKSTSTTSNLYKSFITIYARQKSDKQFLGWYDNYGDLVSNDETYSFSMPNYNYTLIAKWES